MSMEYNRKVAAAVERQGPAAQEREMAFGSVTIAEAASGAEQKVRQTPLEDRGLGGWPCRAEAKPWHRKRCTIHLPPSTKT